LLAGGVGEFGQERRDAKLRRIIPLLTLIFCFVALFKWGLTVLTTPTIPDYTVFWAAARLAPLQPGLVYDQTALTIIQGYLYEMRTGFRPWAYPPTALLPLLPFSKLPFGWSFFAFTGLSLAAYLLAARTVLQERWMLGLIFVGLNDSILFAAVNGQMTMLLGALVTAGIALIGKREIIAGCLIGVAAALKPQLLILAPLALIAGGHYRALISAAAAGLTVVLLTLPFGVGIWLDWVSALPQFLETVEKLKILGRGITPTAMLWNIGITGPAQFVASLGFGLLAATAVWNVFRYQTDVALRLVALIGGGLWCSPYAMNYELALLAPAAALFMLQGRAGERSLILMALSGAALVVHGVSAPFVALAFIAVTLKDHFRLPFASETMLAKPATSQQAAKS
jgi:hypothetical protein